MKTVAIIQARMNSTRLPGKILRPLCGKSILGHVIERVGASKNLNDIVIATTELEIDQLIANEAKKYGARSFQGSENDVLSRYYFAAKENKADVIVRITSDCPLYDPDVLTLMLDQFSDHKTNGNSCDYLCNIIPRTFPRGLDTEIFTFDALERTHREATKPHQREHVTPFIHEHPEIFTIHNHAGKTNLSEHRWTLDTEDDLRFVEAVYGAVYCADKQFSTHEVLQFLEKHPEIRLLNAHVEQKKLGQ